MQLTAHELTAAASAVAALAILGGYLGVRSANRSAVAIAREERSARRATELDALKRVAYSEFLTALSSLADDQMKFELVDHSSAEEADEIWKRSVNSAKQANDRLTQLAQIIHAGGWLARDGG